MAKLYSSKAMKNGVLKCCLAFTLSLISCIEDDHMLTSRFEVDYSIDLEVKSMSGFLHGMNGSAPYDTLINALKPRFLRKGALLFPFVNRPLSFNDQPTIIVNAIDQWTRHMNSPWWPNESAMPYQDFDRWSAFIADLVDRTAGLNGVYDVWNEPESPGFWIGSDSLYFETFKIAHDIIREKLGEQAVISGPSAVLLPENYTFFEDFMDYCLENNIQLDVLSYHDLESLNDFREVQQHAEYLRSKYLENPKYAALGMKELHANEYGFDGSQNIPSSILSYLYFLEQGKVDGACRACFTESDSINTCWNSSIGGLLTNESLRPRSSWWTHRMYSELTKNRVYSFSDNGHLPNFAAKNNNGHGYFLFSNMGMPNTEIFLKNVDAIGLQEGDELLIQVLEIPNTELNELMEPFLYANSSYTVKNNQIPIGVSGLKQGAVYLLRF